MAKPECISYHPLFSSFPLHDSTKASGLQQLNTAESPGDAAQGITLPSGVSEGDNMLLPASSKEKQNQVSRIVEAQP